jgi:hypothetical protein
MAQLEHRDSTRTPRSATSCRREMTWLGARHEHTGSVRTPSNPIARSRKVAQFSARPERSGGMRVLRSAKALTVAQPEHSGEHKLCPAIQCSHV